MITDIKVYRRSSDGTLFVHGVMEGKDVWLRDDGTWTNKETDDRLVIKEALNVKNGM